MAMAIQARAMIRHRWSLTKSKVGLCIMRGARYYGAESVNMYIFGNSAPAPLGSARTSQLLGEEGKRNPSFNGI